MENESKKLSTEMPSLSLFPNWSLVKFLIKLLECECLGFRVFGALRAPFDPRTLSSYPYCSTATGSNWGDSCDF